MRVQMCGCVFTHFLNNGQFEGPTLATERILWRRHLGRAATCRRLPNAWCVYIITDPYSFLPCQVVWLLSFILVRVAWGIRIRWLVVHREARHISGNIRGRFRVDYAQPGLSTNTYRWVKHSNQITTPQWLVIC